MSKKNDLQNQLKTQYKINKNITHSLSGTDCEEILSLLDNEPSAIKLVQSFIAKNEELSRNNRTFGKQRSQAEKQKNKLEKEVLDLEYFNQQLDQRKEELLQKKQDLDAMITDLSTHNEALSHQLQTLTSQNDELTDANGILKRENKSLKNIVDQIRLRLARDTKMLLEYEDSEIRKALIRLFRWTLG